MGNLAYYTSSGTKEQLIAVGVLPQYGIWFLHGALCGEGLLSEAGMLATQHTGERTQGEQLAGRRDILMQHISWGAGRWYLGWQL